MTIRRALAALVMVLLLAKAAWLLGGPHALGLADNGDFDRATIPAGLAHILAPGERYDFEHLAPFFRRDYEIREPGPLSGALQLPSALTARAVVAIHRLLLPSKRTFDISLYGLFHLAIAALFAASALVCERPWRWAYAGALLWVFTDGAHVLALNSFYAEPTSFVLLFVAVCLLLIHPESRWSVRAAALAILLMSFDRMLFVSTAALFALTLVMAKWLAGGPLRRTAPWLLIGALPVFFTTRMARSTMTRDYTYNSVFAGILYHSPKDQHLRLLSRLGVSPTLEPFVGYARFNVRWRARIEALPAELWPTTPVWRRAWVTATEPVVWPELAREVTEAMGAPEPYVGNYSADDPSHPAPFQVYRDPTPRISALRRGLATLGLGWALAFVLIALAGALQLARSPDPAEPNEGLVLAFLLLFAVTQPLIAFVGDGYEAFDRHLLAARLAFDLAVAVGAIAVVRRVWRRVASARSRSSTPTA